MANSYRVVATTEAIEAVEENNANTVKSSGSYKRESNGAERKVIACAIPVPVTSVIMCFEKSVLKCFLITWNMNVCNGKSFKHTLP